MPDNWPNPGNLMPTNPQCLTPGCTQDAAAALKRGLCMKCYSKAKQLVDKGTTTWDQLVGLGLAKEVDEDSLFLTAFKQRMKQREG